MKNNIFYDAHDLLTYNRLNNLVMGVRGHGKTYCFTSRCLALGIKQKDISFVVLVRYKEDIKTIKDCWWEGCDYETLFPNYTFMSKNNIIYANNGLEQFPIGEFIALSTYMRAKRKPRPKVKIIFFDECLNEENDYLKNEITAYLSVCDSVIRNRSDVRCYLVSNHISVINPYFNYFGFNQFGKRFTRGLHDSILEFTDSVDFVKFREGTKLGASIKDTQYGDYALLGHMLLDDTSNVSPLPSGQCKHQFNIALEGQLLEVCMMLNILYVRKSKDYTAIAFTPYVDDAVKCGAVYTTKKLNHYDLIVNKFLQDEIMYETLEIKNAIINFIKFKMGNN